MRVCNLWLGLQKHFRHLEAVALERESIEDFEDFTQPDMDRIEKRAGTLLNEFSEVLSSGLADSKPRQKRKVSSISLFKLMVWCVIKCVVEHCDIKSHHHTISWEYIHDCIQLLEGCSVWWYYDFFCWMPTPAIILHCRNFSVINFRQYIRWCDLNAHAWMNGWNTIVIRE